MKKRGFVLAAVLLAALTATKLLFPAAAAAFGERAARTLGVERGYRETLQRIEARLYPDSPEDASPSEAAAADGLPQEAPPSAPPSPRPVSAELRFEEGIITGEHVPPRETAPAPTTTPEPAPAPADPSPEPEPEVPEAVSVFLEDQAAYLDSYALPDNVDYDYVELPLSYVLPVSGRRSSGFGYRTHPILNSVRFHYGTDIAANSGEDILAFADGTVIFAGESDGYGNYLTIDHGDGWTSSYAHCSKLLVRQGQTVQAGETVALVGATGQVTGPHLHFELRHNGVYLNPEYYLNV